MAINSLKLKWAILSQRTILDAKTNLLSIIDIVEGLEVGFIRKDKTDTDSPILFPIPLFITSLWTFDEIKDKEQNIILKFSIVDPDGKSLGEFKQEITLGVGQKSHRHILNLDNIPLTKSGTYEFLLYSGKTDKFTEQLAIPFEVKINSQPK